MSFFQKIGNAFARFMYGRNGMDQLNRALFVVYIALFLVQSIFSGLHLGMPARICGALLWIAMLLILLRMFSKNLYKRREENSKWMSFWWKVKNNGSGARARHADKEHKYFTCKSCKTICRVPVGKGNIIITCPKCGATIHAKT